MVAELWTMGSLDKQHPLSSSELSERNALLRAKAYVQDGITSVPKARTLSCQLWKRCGATGETAREADECCLVGPNRGILQVSVMHFAGGGGYPRTERMILRFAYFSLYKAYLY